MRGVPILLFAFSLLRLSAQPDAAQTISIDSLFVLLEEEIRDVNTTHQFEETYRRAYAALARAKEEGDPATIARAHDLIATWHYYSVTSNDPDSVYFHDRQALRYLQQTDEQEKIARALVALDPLNDEHWTQDGRPDLQEIQKRVGSYVKREEIPERFVRSSV